ncbi:MAG TPA: Arm DNA-binding domain-containing protein, partial [Gammaproteobacteria bacterium]|nr:Arm DNA-binding domain-containing protein [Gammaproteobacteria bacterium]
MRDSVLKGFGLRITAGGTKSFIVEKRIDGRVRRMTLGRFGELTCEQARKKAASLLGQVATGENPIAERERHRMAQITLSQVLEDFMRVRTNLTKHTLYDYGRSVKVALSDWANKPLLSIRRDMVVARHRELGERSGQYYANGVMRVLRSLFNFAIANYEDGFGNPVVKDNPV